jgi:chromate reductase, NAD(P)H dehydrogenase (quinone)
MGGIGSGVCTGVSSRRLLLISGSLRRQSTNTAVLHTAQTLAPAGTVAVLYERLGDLPHFNPDDDTDQPPGPVIELRQTIRNANAVLFCVPEYAGALPGSFKNLLDWTIGDDQPGSIYGKPVAWINASPRGAANAHESLRKVLGYAHAVLVEAACVNVPITTAMIGGDGLIAEVSAKERISQAMAALIRHVDDPDGPS